VLATSDYFDLYRPNPNKQKNSRRGDGWTDFAAACQNLQGSLRIRFAEADFVSTTATWITR
jgi:hypothetical protein